MKSVKRVFNVRRQLDVGFTLVELLVVIIIIGILVAVAIPVFLNQRQKAFDTHTKNDLKAMVFAQKDYLTEHPNESGSIAASTFVDIHKSARTTLATWVKDGGYCVVGYNRGGSIAGPVNQKYIWYDSLAGGLTFTDVIHAPLTPGACSDPRPSTSEQYWIFGAP